MGSKFGTVAAVVLGLSMMQALAPPLAPQTWPLAPRAAQAQTIDEKIRSIIVKHLGVAASKVTLGARFKEDLGADELDIAELTMAFEEEFKIEIADSDAEKFIRVGDVIRYLRGKVK